MLNPVLTILYQIDPLNVSIGGIQTAIINFIKYAPNDFDIRLVGVTARKDCKISRWHTLTVFGKQIKFFPLFYVEDDNVRSLIPTTFRFFFALLRKDLDSDFLHFHRIEPSLAASSWQGEKTLFIHADIEKQLNGHGESQTFLWRYFPSAYFALERYLLNQFSFILSCNSESLKYFRKTYPLLKDSFHLVKNTVDNEIFYPHLQKEVGRLQVIDRMGLPDDSRFIAFVGRLHPQKDPLLLVRSIAKLEVENIHLLIVGKGELKERIQSEIRSLGLTKRITFLGGMGPQKVADILRISELLVMTSLYEGLPMVVLEALACGIPIVSTDSGETSSLLTQKVGMIIPERTVDATAIALDFVLKDIQRFPSEACVQASKPYWAKTVITQVYDQMRERWTNKQQVDKHMMSTA